MFPLILALVQLLVALSVLLTVRFYARGSSQWGSIFLALCLVNILAGYQLHAYYQKEVAWAHFQGFREGEKCGKDSAETYKREANDYFQRLRAINDALKGN